MTYCPDAFYKKYGLEKRCVVTLKPEDMTRKELKEAVETYTRMIKSFERCKRNSEEKLNRINELLNQSRLKAI